jgi:hypothetical protein
VLLSLDHLSNRAHGREDAEESQRAAAHDLLPVNEDGELAIVPLHRVHIEAEIPPQRRRQPTLAAVLLFKEAIVDVLRAPNLLDSHKRDHASSRLE